MIRRGTALSRLLALLVVASPALLVVGGGAYWASARWSASGDALAAAERRRHVAEAKAAQARLYEPLGAAWASFAGDESSGLVRAVDERAAEASIEARLFALFAAHDGEARGVSFRATDDEEGLIALNAEAIGRVPEAELSSFLAALETEPPYLFAEHVDARASRGPSSMVALRLRLRAYFLPEDPS